MALDHDLAADFFSRSGQISVQTYSRPGTADAASGSPRAPSHPHGPPSSPPVLPPNPASRRPGSAQCPPPEVSRRLNTAQGGGRPGSVHRVSTDAEALASLRPSLVPNEPRAPGGSAAPDILYVDSSCGRGGAEEPSRCRCSAPPCDDASSTTAHAGNDTEGGGASPARLFRDPFLNSNSILLEYLAEAQVEGRAETGGGGGVAGGGSLLSLRRPMVERLRRTAAAMEAAGSTPVTDLANDPLFVTGAEGLHDESGELRMIRRLLFLVQQLTVERDEALGKLRREGVDWARLMELEGALERLRRENEVLRAAVGGARHKSGRVAHPPSRPSTASAAARSANVGSDLAPGVDAL